MPPEEPERPVPPEEPEQPVLPDRPERPGDRPEPTGFDRQPETRRGRLGESAIGRWLCERGNCVLPVYEVEIDHGKGPRFWTPVGTFVAPDLVVLPSAVFVEAKHKSGFTWHYRTGRWTTGIDRHHYEDYLHVQAHSGRPVWILFLHSCAEPTARDRAQGSPAACPTGLFGESLRHLAAHEHHRSDRHGRHGMVYWAHDTLRLLAPLARIETSDGAG